MKHAILMLVHENVELINKLITLYPKDFDIYIHIDASCNIEIKDITPVKSIIKKVSCEWGKMSLVYATLELIKEAGNRYDWYHLVSGSCLPLSGFDNLEYPKCYINKGLYLETEYGKLWYGSQWFTLPNIVINYIINNENEIKTIEKFIPLNNIPDEIVFNTIVMNHFPELVANSNKRFIEMYNIHPRYITKNDKLDGYLFARKVNLEYLD